MSEKDLKVNKPSKTIFQIGISDDQKYKMKLKKDYWSIVGVNRTEDSYANLNLESPTPRYLFGNSSNNFKTKTEFTTKDLNELNPDLSKFEFEKC